MPYSDRAVERAERLPASRNKLDAMETLGRCKGGARVDDRHVETCDRRQTRQCLRNVNRSDRDDTRGRQMNVEEKRSFLEVQKAGPARVQHFGDGRGPFRGNAIAFDKSLTAAVRKIADDDGGAA